eukprot:Skav230863  [mRNA]  locus=scaffold1335:136879:137088:+ [translate_table: standard]
MKGLLRSTLYHNADPKEELAERPAPGVELPKEQGGWYSNPNPHHMSHQRHRHVPKVQANPVATSTACEC